MPEVVAKWTLSDEYYRRVWSQSLRHRTVFRRWTVLFGALLIVCGALLLMSATPVGLWWMVGGLLGSIGVLELLWHFWDRSRWFKAMRAGPQANGQVEIRFAPHGITHVGPTARGEIEWRGIQRVIRTDEGLFLIQGRGLSMFIPLSSLSEPSDARTIEEFHRGASA